MKSARFSTGAGVVNGSSVTSKLVRPRKECSSEDEEGHVGRELNDLGEGENAMTDEDGGMEGEGEEAGVADRRVKSGLRNKPTAKEREEHEATHMPFRDWCPHCMMGRGESITTCQREGVRDMARRPTIVMYCYFFKPNTTMSSQTVSDARRSQ